MHVLKIAFAFVLLCGFSNALPNFGHCSFMEFFCKARRCITVFFKELQKDPSAICSVKYRTMFECVKTVAHDCVQGAMSESQVDFIINGSFNESNFCLKGFFGVPKSSPGSSFTSCTSTYDQKAPLCGKAFHQKFATDWSDPSLCSEYAKAKKCANDLLASECTVSSQTKIVLSLALSDYNPFCANNRDPGATGNDQCSRFLLASKSDGISMK